MATSPMPSWEPKRDRNGYLTPPFSGVPDKGGKIRSGYLTRAFVGAHKRAELLHNPYSLGGPQQGGQNQKVPTSLLPSRGPTRERTYYITPAFSGVPNKGDKIKSGYLTIALSGAHKRAELLHNPCILGGPQQGGQNQKVATSPLPSRGPTRERNCYITPAFSGVRNKRDKIKSGNLTRAFLGAHTRAEIVM